MWVERDEHGFDAPVPLGHPARSSLPDDHAAGPAIEDLNLQVWDGTFHVRIPICATGELASETRLLDRDKVLVD